MPGFSHNDRPENAMQASMTVSTTDGVCCRPTHATATFNESRFYMGSLAIPGASKIPTSISKASSSSTQTVLLRLSGPKDNPWPWLSPPGCTRICLSKKDPAENTAQQQVSEGSHCTIMSSPKSLPEDPRWPYGSVACVFVKPEHEANDQQQASTGYPT